MSDMLDFLESLEKLAYKILMWVLLIPKTLIEVTIHPMWAPDYIKGELEQKDSSFDQYISPVILLLAVALLPALFTGFLPTTGTVISYSTVDPALISEDPSAAEIIGDRFQRFDATSRFISSASDMEYRHSWFVEEIAEDGSYSEMYRENYSSNEYPVELSNNQTQDDFYYWFDTPGAYYVNVRVEKIDPENRAAVETYDEYLYVFVPEKLSEPISIESFSRAPAEDEPQGFRLADLPDLMKSETTIFLALVLLVPPLLMALATKTITQQAISESSLKEIFYIQCYYFSPLNLAIWATFYAFYFYTPNIFFYNSNGVAIVLLPLLLALLWFITVQTQTLARERNTNFFIAFLILAFYFLFMLALGSIVMFFTDLKDTFRVSAVRLYIIATAGLLIAGAIAGIRKKMLEKSRFSAGELAITGMSIFTVTIFALIFSLGQTLPPSELIPEITPTLADPKAVSNSEEMVSSIAVTEEPQPTQVPAEVSSYIEEFDGDLSAWSSFVLGDQNQVSSTVADGRLVYNLRPSGNSVPSAYLINPNFSYTNVVIEVATTNNGNNSNAVILVCQFREDNGWYEFDISNSGQYGIYAMEPNGEYTELATGSSAAIRAGLSTNVYTARCEGNQLSLFVNEEAVTTVQDTTYNFSEGMVGIGVSAFQAIPVDVFIESVSVLQP